MYSSRSLFYYFRISKESKIINNARQINNYKSEWCIEKIKSTALQFEIDNDRKPSIALMGLAFKPNIDDLRESPANYIAQELQNDKNGTYFIVEPNINEHNIFKLTNYQVAFNEADILVFLVAHDKFKKITVSEDKVILDFCGVTN